MRYMLAVLSLMLCAAIPAQGQIRFDLGSGISIGIDVPVYPQLVRVPGYPVYYDPRARSNYFFYDGLYWVYQEDDWYASSWYNGPWQRVERYEVPVYLLRVPVRYYRHAPAYFRGWRADAPPRWGEHWGGDWQERRAGWDRWDRRSAPAAAPLPTYQRQYSGDRYPRAREQQMAIQSRNYRYQPREAIAQQHFPQQVQPQTAPQRSRVESPPQAALPQRSPAPQQRAAQPVQQWQQGQSVPSGPERPVQQAQPRQPVQQAQPRQPVQQAQPRQPVQQAQPRQPPQQAQPRQSAQQEQRGQPVQHEGKGAERRDSAQGKGQENRKENKKEQKEQQKEQRDQARQ
ncbi:MAG: hypothetical protein ACM3SO_19260 [Betaproteobacteria bacterium]